MICVRIENEGTDGPIVQWVGPFASVQAADHWIEDQWGQPPEDVEDEAKVIDVEEPVTMEFRVDLLEPT